MWRSDKPVFPPYKQTLPAVIADSVAKYADREFLVEPGRRLTYRDAERQSARLALGLIAAGIGKGTRLGLVMPNAPDWVLAWWAASRIGALTMSFSTFFQARELGWALKEGDVDTLLISARYVNHDYLERLERAIPELMSQTSPRLVLKSHPYLRRIVVWGLEEKDAHRLWATRGPDALLALADAEPRFDDALLKAFEANVQPADDLIGICTSGSTAEPKIVIHTHGNCVRLTYTYRQYLGLRGDERNYSGMPFFWIGGLNINLMPITYEGACMVFSVSPRVDDILDVMVKEKVTRISMWAAQLAPLAEKAVNDKLPLGAVRLGLFDPVDDNGKTIPPNRRLVSMLGMTESFGMHGAGRFEEVLPESKGFSWGYEIEGIERKIVDPLSGATLPNGQAGELYIRGFTMMRGYYKREWGEVFKPDAWFPTGDLCKIDDDGYLWFTGRGTEMIKTSGANVAPREVEMLMMTYPEVLEAIVFGLPDAVKGENVVAVTVAREGMSIDAEALRARMLQDISAYKVPKSIVAMSFGDIPRTDAGKPRKPLLKEMLAKRLGQAAQAV